MLLFVYTTTHKTKPIKLHKFFMQQYKLPKPNRILKIPCLCYRCQIQNAAFYFFFFFESLIKRINKKSPFKSTASQCPNTFSHNVIMKCNVCFRQLVMAYLVSVQTRAVYPDMFSLQPQEQGKNVSLHFVKGLRRNINAENQVKDLTVITGYILWYTPNADMADLSVGPGLLARKRGQSGLKSFVLTARLSD